MLGSQKEEFLQRPLSGSIPELNNDDDDDDDSNNNKEAL